MSGKVKQEGDGKSASSAAGHQEQGGAAAPIGVLTSSSTSSATGVPAEAPVPPSASSGNADDSEDRPRKPVKRRYYRSSEASCVAMHQDHTGRKKKAMLEEMTIQPLGAGNEVGRSCILLTFAGKTIMLDCGILPSHQGEESLPFLREIEDPSQIDIIFITHFHLDHAAALPQFTQKMKGFKGRIFATHPTVAVMKMILADMIRITGQNTDKQLYSQDDLLDCLEKIECVDFKQKINVDGVTFQFFNAGHVLGAAMVHMEISGVEILYTGDYSAEEDRHLMAAEAPVGCNPDVLICESTFGLQSHPSREERETKFLDHVHAIVRRGGRCLVPMFALGRAQELLLILEEYWRAHPELQDIPVYYASQMASKALELYKTYVSSMNSRVQAQMGNRNPWNFEFIQGLKGQNFRDSGPCVVLASPGMLQHGMSRMLFERWAEDDKNGIIIAGYSVEGTLARQLLSTPREVEAIDGGTITLRAQIAEVSFAAHADSKQSARFIEALAPRTIILVHGERNEMRRLYTSLGKKYSDVEGFQVFMPPNTETVKRYYKIDHRVKAIGNAAETTMRNMQERVHRMTGVLVEGDNFSYTLYAPEQLEKYASIGSYNVIQREHASYKSSFDVLKRCLQSMYESVEETGLSEYCKLLAKASERTNLAALLVNKLVTVTHFPGDRIMLEWNANPMSDMTADSIIAVTAQAEVSPFNLDLTSHQCSHGHDGVDHTSSEQMPESAHSEAHHGSVVPKTEKAHSEADAVNKSSVLDQPQAKNDNYLDGIPLSLRKLQYSVLFRVLKDHYGSSNVETSPHSSDVIVHMDSTKAYVDPICLDIISVDGEGEKVQKSKEKLANLLEHVKDATSLLE